MLNNPFSRNLLVENDMTDFKMPYQLYGRVDLEVMKRKYQNLDNYSYGLIVRLTQ